MKRTILGVLMASMAAPYIATLLTLVTNPGPISVHSLFDLWKVAPFGTVVLLHFWAPMVVASSALALILTAIRATSPIAVMTGAALLGFGFAVVAKGGVFFGTWEPQLTGALTGAICGWIYWRVALAEEPTIT